MFLIHSFYQFPTLNFQTLIGTAIAVTIFTNQTYLQILLNTLATSGSLAFKCDWLILRFPLSGSRNRQILDQSHLLCKIIEISIISGQASIQRKRAINPNLNSSRYRTSAYIYSYLLGHFWSSRDPGVQTGGGVETSSCVNYGPPISPQHHHVGVFGHREDSQWNLRPEEHQQLLAQWWWLGISKCLTCIRREISRFENRSVIIGC